MKVFYSDRYVLPLLEGHRFPASKYELLRRRVTEALVPPADLREPHAATDEEILRAHTPEYLDKVETGRLSEAAVRRIGFPWSEQMVERSRRSSGATVEVCRWALAE